MDRKHVVILLALLIVLTWSVAMTMMGQVAAITALAPALGLTVQQVFHVTRSRAATASGHRVTAVPDKEDDAP
ncbi:MULTISPECIES: hypothetical protein [unclassified Streptomyces]|uniref:hypothetical protein n=1 Tax=unclassified Streptomyces TaxID=2593676 RepID=UPI0006BB2616|nr:hypothetical protein OV450_0716 [Actinobacteria bacterium OV450]